MAPTFVHRQAAASNKQMHIWIDESGSFAGVGEMPSPSCVGALVVPDAKLADLERLYGRLRRNLPKVKGEVKGRLLTARQVADVVGVLSRSEALFSVSLFEFGMHTVEDIRTHQAELAARLGANITEEHHDVVRNWVAQTKAQLLAFKPPAYVQSIVTMELMRKVLGHATMYFSQRRPEELARFNWVIDGKEPLLDKTPWEKWWSDLLLPYMQAQSLVEPGPRFELGDYSHMDRYHSMSYPEYLPPPRDPEDKGERVTNLRSIFGDHVRFSTDPEPGLELVDILTNGIRRALIGHLEPEGWRAIRSIMIHRKDQYIEVLRLNDRNLRLPYHDVLLEFKAGGKIMLIPRHRR